MTEFRRPTHAPLKRGGAPEPIADVLSRVLKGVRPATRRGGIADTWAEVAGEELGTSTRPATLKAGVLTVEVSSTALLAELNGFRRTELLAKLLSIETTGRITELRFRLGAF